MKYVYETEKPMLVTRICSFTPPHSSPLLPKLAAFRSRFEFPALVGP